MISRLSIGETKGKVGAWAGEGETACGDGRGRVTDSLGRRAVRPFPQPPSHRHISSQSADGPDPKAGAAAGGLHLPSKCPHGPPTCQPHLPPTALRLADPLRPRWTSWQSRDTPRTPRLGTQPALCSPACSALVAASWLPPIPAPARPRLRA